LPKQILKQNRNGDKPILSSTEGTKVFVFDRAMEKIQLTDGTEGWIDSNAIRR
jgi:hypothetical protein